MKYRPYISIDVETTGVDTERDKILQIGLVYDNMENDSSALHTWSCLINPYSEEFHGRLDPVALDMNAWIFKEIVSPGNPKYPVLTPSEARKEFDKQIRDFYYNVLHKDARSKEERKDKIVFAGKNLQGFDIPMLKNNGFINAENRKYIGTRVLDVGPMYYSDFGYVPCLGEINKLTGCPEVSHDALDDAWNVVQAIRNKVGVEAKI